MTKLVSAALIVAFLAKCHPFVHPASFVPPSGPAPTAPIRTTLRLHAYVPDGLTPDEYRRIKDEDSRRTRGKDLGRLGPKGFQSRSLQGWQQAYEKGQASHTYAPINYKIQLQRGLIRKEDVPYMVRGGSWDNRDVRGAPKLKWSKHDREYANGGYKKEQSASLLGSGPGLDWTGTHRRSRDVSKRSLPGFS